MMEYNELLTGLQGMMENSNNVTNPEQPINNYITQKVYNDNDNTGLMHDIGTLIQRQEGNQ